MNIRFFRVKVRKQMSQINKISSKIYPLIKAVASAAVLPVLFIYIMIAKPDYHFMNALSHVVVPTAQWIGDIITWPFRAVVNSVENIAELSNLRAENEELRAALDSALINKNACEVAILENKKLKRELNIVSTQPRDAVIADVVFDNSALGHNTFLINRGATDNIGAGMVVTSTDLQMAGVVIDVATNFSRVRALTDSDTNIAVRVVGSEVYGFLTGNGSKYPTFGFFSDPEFQPSDGIKLVTCNISGVLPAGIIVGEIVDGTDIKVLQPSALSRVMVLKFDTHKNEYR